MIILIEWIIGAAVLGLLSGGAGKKKNASAFSLTSGQKSLEAALPAIHDRSKYSEWRYEWSEIVDHSQWMPKGLASRIIQEIPPRVNGGNTQEPAAKHTLFEKALLLEFADHNQKFLTTQKEKLADFFESVEQHPLTDEQMDCCICMDEAIEIVAAAGSGKTSTIVARIGYALREGLIEPGQILVLAFNGSVKEELEARISRRLGGFPGVQQVKVKTFNAFGLEVIGKSIGRKPKLADWVENGRDVQVVSEIVEDLRQRDPKFSFDWDMFRVVFGRDIGDWNNIGQPPTDGKGHASIRTAEGTFVKSEEERMISDFLFYHGVNYEYERPYEHDTVSESHSQYHPDFYYPEIALYHEHFALDAEGKAPAHFTGDYVAGVDWKRRLHIEKETQLFETTSHEIRKGVGLDKLKEELERRGVLLRLDADRVAQGQEPIPTKQLASTIRAFQQHVKSNVLSFQDLRQAVVSFEGGHQERLIRFVSLYERISNEWQRRLNAEESVDFDDMLLMAIEYIENGKFQSPYKMILADEFQDVSQAKLRLLSALKENAGPSANLCVVGDDWQGINRFAGADISVMTDFHSTFRHSTQLTLSRTFRCPQLLCDASSEFIQKNPTQIRKEVKTTSSYDRPLLHAVAAETEFSAMERLEKDLRQLHGAAKAGALDLPPDTKVSVMLLGRYHKNKPGMMTQWISEFGNYLTLKYSTVHASKGLEADYVMLLNVTDEYMGFPSQIEDDPVLQLAMPQPDPFPCAEERRLFYVALTRARRQTRIYSLRGKPSRFLMELAKDNHLKIKTESGELKCCPKCQNGALKQKTGKFGPFEVCSNEPRCSFKRSATRLETNGVTPSPIVRLTSPISEGETCPTCKRGSMVVRIGKNDQLFLGCSAYPKCRTTAAVPAPLL